MDKVDIKKQAGLGELADDALMIRDAVFIAEQGVQEQREHDDEDQNRIHYVGYLDDNPVTTARVQVQGDNWHIERVATLSHARGRGLAQQLMQQIMTDARLQSARSMDLNAQVTAKPFYDKLGFTQRGDVFLDAGMNHVNMQREL